MLSASLNKTFLFPGVLGNSIANMIIMLQIFLTSDVTVATCEGGFPKVKLINQDLLKIDYENLAVKNLAIISIG